MKGNQDGFTLLEILASVVILGILLIIIFQVFIFSQKATTANQEKLEEITIAGTVLEQIKSDGCLKQKVESEEERCKIIITGVGLFGDSIDYYGKEFNVKVEVNEPKEKDLELYVVEVTVEGPRAAKGKLEGLVNKSVIEEDVE